MNRFIYISLLLFFPGILAASDSTRLKTNILGIKTGYSKVTFIDPYASSNIYSGKSVPINFHWFTETKNHLEIFDIGFNFSNFETKSQQVNLTEFNGFHSAINYGYLFKTIIKNKSVYYFGPNINFLYSFRSHKYTFFEKIIYETVDVYASLDIAAAAKFDLKKDYVITNASYSLMAYTGFLKYSLGSPYKGEIQFLPRYTSFNFNVNYFLYLSKYFFINAGYKASYYRFPKFNNSEFFRSLNNQFSVGLNIKL